MHTTIRYRRKVVHVYTYTTQSAIDQAFVGEGKPSKLGSVHGFYVPDSSLGSIHLRLPASLETIAHEVYHLIHAHTWGSEEWAACAQGHLTHAIQMQIVRT